MAGTPPFGVLSGFFTSKSTNSMTLDAYSRAIRINPYISEVWFDLGSLYESCNNQISDTIDAYAHASELDPGNHVISQRLQLLKNAQATGAPWFLLQDYWSSSPATIDIHLSPNLLASVKQLKYGHTLSDYNIQTALVSPLANGVSHLHWQAAQTRPYPFQLQHSDCPCSNAADADPHDLQTPIPGNCFLVSLPGGTYCYRYYCHGRIYKT
ncbi:hypothetical protein F4604DRAFT_1943578 [Suillus subluteus]|nr:hypothetical protein F4604DRAFT_1943578 [Suillus subluteus]